MLLPFALTTLLATAPTFDGEPVGPGLRTAPAEDQGGVRPVRVPEPMSSPNSTRISASIGALLGGYGVGYIPAGSSAVQDDLNAGTGIYGRLGVQVTDLLDLDLEGDAALTLPNGGYFLRGAATVGVTPLDWLTVGAGPVVVFSHQESLQLQLFAHSPTHEYSYLGGTARVDFHLSAHRNRVGREGLVVGVAFDVATSIGASMTAGYTCGIFGGCPMFLPTSQPGTPGYLSEGLFVEFGYSFY